METQTWLNVNESAWVSLRNGRVWRVRKTENGDWFFSHFHVSTPSVICVDYEYFDTPYEAMISANDSAKELSEE